MPNEGLEKPSTKLSWQRKALAVAVGLGILGLLIGLLFIIRPAILFPIPLPPTCVHSPCTRGAALDPKCDACVAMVCPNGTKSPCCGSDGGWGQDCVNQVASRCVQRCRCDSAADAGQPPFNMHACDCTLKECSGASDPSCCTPGSAAGWSAACVDYMKKNYAGGCKPLP